MFRCKVCGYIADAAQPVECPSCGASWDRFQQLTDDEVSLLIGGMTSYGIREQDTDVTPIDDSRRIRSAGLRRCRELLALHHPQRSALPRRHR